MTEQPDYDAGARETPDSPAARALAALTTALHDLTADAIEGCAIERVYLYGTYTDQRSGYIGDLRRAVEPDGLRALIAEHQRLIKELRVYRLRCASAEQLFAQANRQVERLQAWLCLCADWPPATSNPACIVHGDPRTPRVSTRAWAEAFEKLQLRIHRDFNFDAGECAPPEGETALRMMDDLVTFANECDPERHAAELAANAQAEIQADLRAARDMIHRPDDRHRSPGYNGEKPDHHGPFETCAMPACATSRAQHEAVADIQDLTYELFAQRDTCAALVGRGAEGTAVCGYEIHLREERTALMADGTDGHDRPGGQLVQVWRHVEHAIDYMHAAVPAPAPLPSDHDDQDPA